MKPALQSLLLAAILAAGIAWPRIADRYRRYRILKEPLRALRANARREAERFHRTNHTGA